ncbi:MAG: Gly-zipperOmpA domain-containing protein [Nitrospira sp.]|nr:MAG: Gly-zipperOmpA domain-containing protein [Nitrospira sp.]
MRQMACLCVLSLVLFGCAAPKPILYPNAHYQQVGADAAQADIQDCMALAKEAGASSSDGKTAQVATGTVGGGAIGSAAGAVGGAILGHPGRGAMVGAASGATAGFLRGLFKRSSPSAAFTNYVDRCLRDRGYDPTGWQ